MRELLIASSHICKGIWNLLLSTELNSSKKLSLLIDYARLLLHPTNPFTIRAFNLKIQYPSYKAFVYLFNEIICSQVYPVRRNLKTYFDCGANIGLSILWYKAFNPKVEVIAFEPDPTSFSFLRKNLKNNKTKGVTVLPAALAGKKGSRDFYILDNPVQVLDSGLKLNQNIPYKKIQVETVRLSQFLKSKVSLIKMDIEGGEYEVLDELIKSKKFSSVQQMVIEIHYFNHAEELKFKKLVRALEKRGSVRLGPSNRNTTMIYFNLQKN